MAYQDGDLRGAWKPGPRARALAGGLIDLIFPPQALDGGARPLTQGLTAEAWRRIQFIEAPLCDGCGTPFEYAIDSRCPACTAAPRAFDRARAACFYGEASRDLILQFKHADRTDLAPMFRAWLSRAAADLLAEADALVPVPLHRGRLFRRRYNQAAELARPLARGSGAAYLADVLRRVRDTGSQAGRSGSGRRRNVQGAFKVPERLRLHVEGKRILVIDDVMTTGATAEACARALKRAGAVAVDVAVIARTGGRDLE
jgi:ComF family protein